MQEMSWTSKGKKVKTCIYTRTKAFSYIDFKIKIKIHSISLRHKKRDFFYGSKYVVQKIIGATDFSVYLLFNFINHKLIYFWVLST